MKINVGYIDVAGWGSDRNARIVRGPKEKLPQIRQLLRDGHEVVAETEKGLRKIILYRNGRLYTRMP